MELQGYVDDLIGVYKAVDPDAVFKLSPVGPDLTMRKELSSARDALAACAQAQVSTAASDLVARINTVLDGS